MASVKRINAKLKIDNQGKSNADLSERFIPNAKISSGHISKSKEFKRFDAKSVKKIEKFKSISVSLLSDFKAKLFESEEALTKFGKVVIEAEGSSIPIAINLGLRIKNQHSLPVSISVSTGSKYITVAPDSPIREYQNVPSITVNLTQSVLHEKLDTKDGKLIVDSPKATK